VSISDFLHFLVLWLRIGTTDTDGQTDRMQCIMRLVETWSHNKISECKGCVQHTWINNYYKRVIGNIEVLQHLQVRAGACSKQQRESDSGDAGRMDAADLREFAPMN